VKAIKKKRKRRRRPLDPVARRNRKFLADIRTAFTNCGFLQISTRNVQFTHKGFTTDFDAIFCKGNVLVVVEDTTEKNPDDHLRKKSEAWAGMASDSEGFIEALSGRFPGIAEYLANNAEFATHDYQIRFVYISLRAIDELVTSRYPRIGFLDNARLQYFVSLSKTISRSALFEFLNFLKIDLAKYGIQSSAHSETTFPGLYLPETPSGFKRGHKIVSLLMDPKTLLERCYVLRADGWRDSEALYQRLLVKNKIKEMRQYLKDEGRVFVNNVIVTFPSDTKLIADGKLITSDDSTRRSGVIPICITLPHRFASIGIIDGQHRIFAYHEGTDELESFIAKLRVKQNLLVTGIVYPPALPPAEAQQFEAKLFLEINDKQKRVRGDLKQSIEMIVRPRSAVAVAKAVVNSLAASAPFLDILETHAFDTGKLKTTSIVSYGLKYVVDPERPDSMYTRWDGSQKPSFHAEQSALDAYIGYCTSALRQYFNAFKQTVGSDMWTTDREKSRVLNATSINGLIYAMRLIVAQRPPPSFEEARKRFKKITVSFEPSKFRYKSSHWKDLGERIFNDCFK
jgi:DGQHR domain-containing protein